MFNPQPLYHGRLVGTEIGYELCFFRLNFIEDRNFVFFMFVSIVALRIYMLYAPIISKMPYSSIYSNASVCLDCHPARLVIYYRF